MSVAVDRLPLRRRVGPADVPGVVGSDALLAPLRRPEITVTVDVTVGRPDGGPGWATLRSHHALAGDRVASTSRAGGPVEVTSHGIEHWQTELARAADVPPPRGAPPPPADGVEAPLDVLLASGEAVRAGRRDLLEELVRRGGDADGLLRLQTAVVGRLLATVAGPPRLGWSSWLLFGDGWRVLEPVRRQGRPTVRLARATPADLGRHVAALVTLVRGRS